MTKDRKKRIKKDSNYQRSDNMPKFSFIVMEKSEYSPNRCVLQNDELEIWLYQTDCIEFMNEILQKYPEGRFDISYRF